MTPSEQGTITVAIVGIVATAVTAIIGLLVQIVLAGAAARREQRRRRYDELIAVYGEWGRSMSAATYSYNQLFRFEANGSSFRASKPTTINAQVEADAKKHESRHGKMMLRLHDVHPVSLIAIKRWQNAMEEELPGDPHKEVEVLEFERWWDSQTRRVESELRQYYKIAGIHARSQLEWWGRRLWTSWRLSNGKLPSTE